jgi:hypothetical protein
MKLNHALLIFTITLMSACNGIGTASFKGAGINNENEDHPGGGDTQSGGSGIDTSLIFTGVSSVSAKSDSTLTLNWISHPDAVAYDVFDATTDTLTLANTVFGQASTSVNMSNLTPSATYKFRVRIRNAAGLYDNNANDITVTMNAAPDAPSTLNLINPSVSTWYLPTPTIRVSGVKSGDTVKIFSDSSCAIEVGSAVSSGSTVDITSHPLAPTTYAFYAASINSSGSSSPCSDSSVAYVLERCPAGYAEVPQNATLGVNTFCVAQFEMKNIGSVAISQAIGTPWVGINQAGAKTACTSLGTGFDLISNPEWMSIALDIEKTAANWSSGVVGTGMLNRGHSDNFPPNSLAVSDVNNPYIGTGNNAGQAAGSGWEQKRTHTLSNNEIIWDFSGNTWEWVDWSLGGGLTSGPTSCPLVTLQFPNVSDSCGALAYADYMPANPVNVTAANYDSNYGLGVLHSGTGGAALRGNYWADGPNSGVFTLALSVGSDLANDVVGFRCVWRP